MDNKNIHQNTFCTLLHTHGLRATPQRVAICQRLLQQHCHFTAQNLYEELLPQFPTISTNTIYMALTQLESLGLVRRFYMEGNAVYDSNTATHDHAHCRKCGLLIDLTPAENQQIPRYVNDWFIEWGTRLSGLCPRCKANDTESVM